MKAIRLQERGCERLSKSLQRHWNTVAIQMIGRAPGCVIDIDDVQAPVISVPQHIKFSIIQSHCLTECEDLLHFAVRQHRLHFTEACRGVLIAESRRNGTAFPIAEWNHTAEDGNPNVFDIVAVDPVVHFLLIDGGFIALRDRTFDDRSIMGGIGI